MLVRQSSTKVSSFLLPNGNDMQPKLKWSWIDISKLLKNSLKTNFLFIYSKASDKIKQTIDKAIWKRLKGEFQCRK